MTNKKNMEVVIVIISQNIAKFTRATDCNCMTLPPNQYSCMNCMSILTGCLKSQPHHTFTEGKENVDVLTNYSLQNESSHSDFFTHQPVDQRKPKAHESYRSPELLTSPSLLLHPNYVHSLWCSPLEPLDYDVMEIVSTLHENAFMSIGKKL